MTSTTLYAVDASIFIFRAYFSLPPNWHADNGFETNALYGYATFLLRLLEQERPQWLACAFDESLGSGFRHQIYPDYKSNRVLPDEALAYQLNACREFTALMGVCDLVSDEFEADDLIASLGAYAHQHNLGAWILSRDKDLGQVLRSDLDRFWDFPNGHCLDYQGVQARFGVTPERIADLLALTGDPIDAIPGVPGIGVKTAARLLEQFDDCEALLSDLDAVAGSGVRGAARLSSALQDNAAQLRLALQLTRLREDALAPDFVLSAWDKEQVDVDLLEAFLAQNGLSALLKRCRRLAEGQR